MLASSSSSATTNASTATISDIWDSFKNKRTNTELYSENAVVMYVPTAVGVRGNTQIRKFFLNPQFSEKVNSVQEVVYNTVASNSRLIEESTWTIHFHTGECKWLVPQLDERYLMNATIKIPVTTSVAFDKADNRIESIRYTWDQASVLKQLKVISDKVQWPVIGEQQIEALRSPQTVRLTGLNAEEVNVDHHQTQKEQQQNQFMPGRIFGPVDPKDQVRSPVRHAEPNAPPARNIFTYQPPTERPLVAPTNKLNSSFSFTHDDGSSTINKLSSTLSNTNISQSKSMPAAGKVTPKISRNIIG
ncbi:hypothetical protein V8B55DRAFT_1442967 [Mucor lusitanicus]|uniref:Uncharacterized protein n=2 Tax=Mucor circinelloides f. lusitanicus TaxID=29924 RepID=A0A168KLX3_MUCCL|nr:hypothetical protein FB192DRAFT_1353082 [Mucor lusitanicus]OAD02545.1 hypothetical protein MUCCIDRAFT_156563 [Mucor lusitanicus CBS 277.49]